MANFYNHPIGWAYPIFSTPAVSNFTLDAATDAVEWIVAADEAATITRIGVRQGAVTGTSPSYRVSLQGVDASGNPDGTIKGVGNAAYVDISPVAGGDGTFSWHTLGATYTCTRGEKLAIVIAYTGAATIDGSNNCSFTISNNTTNNSAQGNNFPYVITNNGGVRARAFNYAWYAYGSASKAYGRPLETAGNLGLTTATTPDEAGIVFTLPAGWGDTYKVNKAYLNIRLASAGKTARVTLYDSDGSTVLQQVDHDTDLSYAASSGAMCEIPFDEVTLSTLSFGTQYRLTVMPVDAANTVTFYYVEVDAVADWDAWPLMGAQMYYTSRADAGSWTDTNTRKPIMALGISDWTEPASGGGSIFASPVIT